MFIRTATTFSKEDVMKRSSPTSDGFTLVELMVVIVIVGILAAVAIPKFLDASQKAKASEFPTVLRALYTGQAAFQAEHGRYMTTFQYLKDSTGVDIPSSSKWFGYSLPSATSSSFVGQATVLSPGFGNATASDYGTIDQTNSKYCTDPLQKYCPSWK